MIRPLLRRSKVTTLDHPTQKDILSLLFHCDLISLRWVGHLVLTVHWTSCLDGALDISSRRCIGRLVSTVHWTLSKRPKESYKYDLANSLVPLIALSHDHQNHSKWPKWGHVRYIFILVAGQFKAGRCNYMLRLPWFKPHSKRQLERLQSRAGRPPLGRPA